MVVSQTDTSLRDGRYQVLATLGEGAQGETLEALDKREGRLVAVKRFRIKGARSWKAVELAEREARVLARLEHRALPRYLDHFEEDGALHLVMDKVEGVSLARHLDEGRRFSRGEVTRFLWEAADVLAYLHGQAPPVIHRDLKPGNVIVRPDGSFAFVDFGCVRDSLRPDGGSTVVGTFGYMAPEQFQGRALPSSDVYSVGATALTMLTGIEPENLPHKGLGIDVNRSLRGTVGQPLVRVLERMLVPDPDVRTAALLPLLQALPMSDDFSAPRPTARAKDRGASGRRTEETRAAPGSEKSPRRRRVGRRFRNDTRRGRDPAASEVEEFGRELKDQLRRNWDEVKRELFDAPRRAPATRRRRHPPSWTDRSPDAVSVAFATLAISIAQLVIWLLLRVAAPLVLTLLALVLGSPLRRAAQSADRLGKRVDDKLRYARDGALDPSRSHFQPRVPVAGPTPRIRVTPNGNEPPTDADWHGEHREPSPSVPRREP